MGTPVEKFWVLNYKSPHKCVLYFCNGFLRDCLDFPSVKSSKLFTAHRIFLFVHLLTPLYLYFAIFTMCLSWKLIHHLFATIIRTCYFLRIFRYKRVLASKMQRRKLTNIVKKKHITSWGNRFIYFVSNNLTTWGLQASMKTICNEQRMLAEGRNA